MGVVHLQEYKDFRDTIGKEYGVNKLNELVFEQPLSDRKLEAIICRAARETNLRAKIEQVSRLQYRASDFDPASKYVAPFSGVHAELDSRNITIQWHRIPLVMFSLFPDENLTGVHFSFYGREMIDNILFIGRAYKKKRKEYFEKLTSYLV